MSRRDKILKLALSDKENINNKNDTHINPRSSSSPRLIPLQVIAPQRTRSISSSSRSSSSSSPSSSSSSSTTSSSRSSLSDENEHRTAHDTPQNQVTQIYNRSDHSSLVNTPLPGSPTSESVISNSIIGSPSRNISGNLGVVEKNPMAQSIGGDRRPSFALSGSASPTGDFSPDDNDADYEPRMPRTIEESSNSDSSDYHEPNIVSSPVRKRRKGVINSKKLRTKRLRNEGAEYVSLSKNKRVVPARQMKPPCGTKCRLQCFANISEDERKKLFQDYWSMASLTRQRDFIASSMMTIHPKYQYKKLNNNRKAKHGFYFTIKDNKIRVCKIFYKNTLGINDRPIRTVIEKTTETGIVETEKRGRHGKQKSVGNDIIQSIKNHIESIPRIESHYLRQQSSREYIEGGKNIADLFRDYKKKCEEDEIEAAEEHTYRRVFKQCFNISFFVPKKDMCELCSIHANLSATEQENMKDKFFEHHNEKQLSRNEKEEDKKKVNNTFVVACYDLQAVLPLPMCKASAFYYKSKLNVCNFTVCELAVDYCECYVWSETDGLRGANEIGSCVLSYIKNKAESVNDANLEIVFYSDNCCGQQKNQYMFSMYMYALSNFPIKSITHKFLITGHTQNENDNVHSVIEKEVKKFLKSSPIYVPEQYMTLIQTARKKGRQYTVKSMTYSDFYDLKNLAQECGSNFSKNLEGETVRLSDIKIVKFEKDVQGEINVYYKNSYAQNDFKQLFPERSSRVRRNKSRHNFTLKKLNNSKLELTNRKKSDLKSLVDNGLIPRYYANSFYNYII